MTAYSELNSDAERATDHSAPADALGLDHLAPETLVPADSIGEPAQVASPSIAKHSLTGVVLRRLAAILTTQYVIVTALAALAAVTVASEASRIINVKLELIVAALKRF